MCAYCTIVQSYLGVGYFCRPCWRRMYRFKQAK